MTERLNIKEEDLGDDNEDLTAVGKGRNTDLRDVSDSALSPGEESTEKVELDTKPTIDLEKWEKEMEVRDRFQLWGWALRRKAALVRRHAVLDVVTELKLRFKKVLYLYQGWKEEKRFKEM